MTSIPLRRLALPIATALLLAACGGINSSGNTNPSSSGKTSNQQIAKCLRNHGIDIPGGAPGKGGFGPPGGTNASPPAGFAPPNGGSPTNGQNGARMRRALKDCGAQQGTST